MVVVVAENCNSLTSPHIKRKIKIRGKIITISFLFLLFCVNFKIFQLIAFMLTELLYNTCLSKTIFFLSKVLVRPSKDLATSLSC